MSKCTFFAMGCSLPERPRFADYILLKWRTLIVSTIPGRFGKGTNKPSDATEYPFRLGCLQFASRVLPEQLKVQISKLQDQQKGTQTQQKSNSKTHDEEEETILKQEAAVIALCDCLRNPRDSAVVCEEFLISAFASWKEIS